MDLLHSVEQLNKCVEIFESLSKASRYFEQDINLFYMMVTSLNRFSGGSLPGSRGNSRPASRQGSKPPSRHGSNLSLDSTGKYIVDFDSLGNSKCIMRN